MNEESAKEMWCPMVRILMTPDDPKWNNSIITNRMEFVKDGRSEARCLGSACAWWVSFLGNNGNGCCGVLKYA